MEILYSAVLSELVSRAVSFLLAKREEQAAAAAQEERLRSLLLRSRTIVEEAERRLVTNRAMLQQLGALRDEAFRGYYVLDAAARFNPAKRVRVPSGDPEACRASAARLRELRQAVRGLEAMIGDMKEFVVFLTTHPLLHRQPYSAHLFVDKCMFGRHMEKERIMEFLLQPEPPGAARLGVLPIVGPAHIGKSTLVEHVCHDERVRDHFSLILFYRGKSLVDETVASFRDKCVVKHQTDNEASSGQRLLIIIELFEDLDEETWKNMLYSSERSMAQGSRMIITSRSEKIVRFGTTRALRLKCLSPEAYWHFFKMTVFGSDDPGQHPKLASLAMEMASLMQGSFLFANIGAVVLRDHFDTQSWSRAVRRIREYLQKNVSLFGEYTDDIKDKDHPRFTWSLINQKPDRYCMLYDIYERGSQEEVPEIPYSDMLAGSADVMSCKLR
ncbi:putative disease resistance protein RGA3 [Setaria italica]|uniref:putative disease resistance protein RGA3 n=1 Tax=Setaria italica TaxID=4555 RepID=UPI000350D914|nr:putative disease resistance protein RGA3 [Setaria italica]